MAAKTGAGKEESESDRPATRGGNASDAAEIYVQALLKVHAQYHEVVREAFDMDPAFVSSLDKVCHAFLFAVLISSLFSLLSYIY